MGSKFPQPCPYPAVGVATPPPPPPRRSWWDRLAEWVMEPDAPSSWPLAQRPTFGMCDECFEGYRADGGQGALIGDASHGYCTECNTGGKRVRRLSEPPKGPPAPPPKQCGFHACSCARCPRCGHPIH